MAYPSKKPYNRDDETVMKYARVLALYQKDIFVFVKDMWGLTPQKVKPSFQKKWDEVVLSSWDNWENLKPTVTAEWFGDYNTTIKEWDWYDWEFGKKLTWQQTILLHGVNKANNGDAKPHISVVSGHGIGKSSIVSLIILWYLYCYLGSQVPVTAPTSSQMHDVLWKELNIWIGRMPVEVSQIYDWSKDYVRIKHDPESWFARARTSTKENTEAIAGVHAEHVLIVADEASGIPEQVFNTAEGALTSGNVMVILISNGTRATGYFFDTHHRNKEDWQLFSFNCEHSPIVNKKYVERQEKRHGRESDEFKIRVSGGFPSEDAMDDSGYLQLISDSKVIVEQYVPNLPFLGRKILGVDPSGEGKDTCTYCLRDRFRAEIVHEETTTNPKKIAEKILTFIHRYNLDPNDVVVGAFGVGTDVGKEVALASQGKYEIYTVLEGNSPIQEEEYNGRFFHRNPNEFIEEDEKMKDLYANIRALMHFRTRDWLIQGGVIVDKNPEKSDFKQEIIEQKYKRSLLGNKIQMMSKKEMKKLRIKSPNKLDALSLSQLRDLNDKIQTKEEEQRIQYEENSVDNPYAVL